MTRTARNGFLALMGILLVVVGGALLADRVLGPVFAPIKWVINAVGIVAWPLALIAVGVVLITASRHADSGAKLYRSRTDRVIGGVLGGLGKRLGVAPNFVRVVFVVLALLTSGMTAAVLYLLALAFIPEEPVAADAQSGFTPAPPAPPARPAPAVPPMPAPAAPTPPPTASDSAAPAAS